jgi:uncharacterized protein DUF4136
MLCKLATTKILVWLATALIATSLPAQKVKVGYDKSVDFSRFSTYTWSDISPRPAHPLLWQTVVTAVDTELQSKGWHKLEKDGDLTLMPEGGIDFNLSGASGTPILPTYSGPPPAINATMWTGAEGGTNVATWESQGTLVLTFVNRTDNKVVWRGSVSEKLDNNDKGKSLELASKAVSKLLRTFPATKQ